MTDEPLTHENRTDPVGLAAAAHRQRMTMLGEQDVEVDWDDEAAP